MAALRSVCFSRLIVIHRFRVRLRRLSGYFAIGLGLFVSRPVAQTTADPAAATGPAETLTAAEQAELQALLGATLQTSITVRGSLGWRDNLLYSPFTPVARTFARGEIEALFWRPSRGAWEFLSFLNGDVLRYLSPPAETGGEYTWFAHGEARWEPAPTARVGLKADGFLQNSVIDLSETEATRVVLPARTHGGYFTANLRLTLPGGVTLEPLGQAKRTRYRDFPGDHDETKFGSRLEWKRSDRLILSLGWFEASRRYDERNDYTAGGRPRADTRLRFRQQEADVRLASQWQSHGDWSAAISAGRLENRDGTSGYFDYDQERIRLELGWEQAAWSVSLDAEAKRVEYALQTVGIGIAPPKRRADEFDVVARLERTLGDRWTLLLEHHWERSRANQAEFSYRANTVLAGVQREF